MTLGLGLGFCGSFLYDIKAEPGPGMDLLNYIIYSSGYYDINFLRYKRAIFCTNLSYRMDRTDHVIIKKFNIADVERSNVITIVGARGVGKSLIVKNILDQFPNIRRKVLFGCKDYDNECDEIITNNPEMEVHESYSSSAVQSIVEDNVFLIETTRSSIDTLVVFYDCLYRLTQKSRTDLSCLMSLSNVMCVFVLQYIGFSERFIFDRSNCMFMMIENNLSQIKKRYQMSKAGDMYSYEVFERIHQQITNDGDTQDSLVVKGADLFYYKTGSMNSVDTRYPTDIKSAISMSSIEKSETMGTSDLTESTNSTESEMDRSEQSEFLRKISIGNRKQNAVDQGRCASCTCDSSSVCHNIPVACDMLVDFLEPDAFSTEPEQDVVIRIENPGKRIKSVSLNIEYK